MLRPLIDHFARHCGLIGYGSKEVGRYDARHTILFHGIPDE